MQRSKRASVESQINLQPLLLAAAMSRASESGSVRSSKRDSGFSDIVGSFPTTSGSLHRISLKRHSRMESSPSESEISSPIYRLYPSYTANGSRRLKAMEDRPDLLQQHTHNFIQQPGRNNHSFETAVYTPLQQDSKSQGTLSHEDDVFQIESSTPAEEFGDHFSLPLSRAESHDSFVSFASRPQTPEEVDNEEQLSKEDTEASLIEERRAIAAPEPSILRQNSIEGYTANVEENREQDDYNATIEEQYPSVVAESAQQQQYQHNHQHYTPSITHSQLPHATSSITEHQDYYKPNHSEQCHTVDQFQGHYIPSITEHQNQDRYTPSAPDPPPPSRGRQPLQTYQPKGLRFSGRASLNYSRPTSRVNMTLTKTSMSGQIEDTDDTPGTPETMTGQMYSAGDRSSAESIFSQETNATSLMTLPPLQSKGPDYGDAHQLEPLLEDDPRSFDLVDPPSADEPDGVYALEKRAELMFSEKHLQGIFDDPKLLMKFTSFLNLHRSQSIPLLIYYLDALKALRAIKYANAIAEALEPISGQDFTEQSPQPTNNSTLERKTQEAFRVLTQEDLPAYISYVWIQVVSTSIQRRITGTLAPHLREASEGLAETFCLSDPSRKDNPIVFASEEFARTTQYGMTYAIGRNCRFLQGPKTSPAAIRRLAIACQAGKESNEVFVNYRRDGSPFLNLLMTAPLLDSKGVVRYFIGAQVDVSGLLKGCNELPALAELVEKEQEHRRKEDNDDEEFQELAEMFNGTELDTVRKYGGRMHKEYVDDSSDHESLADRRPRMVLKDNSQDIMDEDVNRQRQSSVPAAITDKLNGKLEGVYQHYLLVRPAPSLRILFTSPSLRVPGILQSPFLHRIGGSARVRNDLAAALAEGRGVTAKIRWLLKADEDGEGEGRPRWIHCTPLLGHSGAVGVWMIVLVEEEGYIPGSGAGRKFRQAPPVAAVIGGKDWDDERTGKRPGTSYTLDLETARRGGSHSTDKSTTRSFSVEPSQRAERHVRERDSVVGQAISAPSPVIADKRGTRSNIIDFDSPQRGTSRNTSYNSNHLVNQLRPRSKSKGHSNASLFSLDLK